MVRFLKKPLFKLRMVMTDLLLRQGELFLKGGNIATFERRLAANVEKICGVKIAQKLRGRLILPYFPEHQKLKQIFGLVSYSPALKVEKDLESIKAAALALVREKKWDGFFRVETKRSAKDFSFPSLQINKEVGEYIINQTKLDYAAKTEKVLHLEINAEGAFLYLEIIHCFGGLPVGTSGKINLLIENKASFLAGLLFLKRGCELNMIYPQKEPVNKFQEYLSLLQEYSPFKIKTRNFSLAELKGMIVSGQNFENYSSYDFSGEVFRPLIAYSEEEIRKELNSFLS